MTPEAIAYLKKMAEQKTWDDIMDKDGSYIDDFAGGNIDDSYYGGVRTGEADTARYVLKQLGISFTIEED
jgi:hypothetical protein